MNKISKILIDENGIIVIIRKYKRQYIPNDKRYYLLKCLAKNKFTKIEYGSLGDSKFTLFGN